MENLENRVNRLEQLKGDNVIGVQWNDEVDLVTVGEEEMTRAEFGERFPEGFLCVVKYVDAEIPGGP